MLNFIQIDRDFDREEFARNLLFPWLNTPQYRFLIGRSPIPTLTDESLAASGVRFVALWVSGLSTRALVGHIVASRYTMPLQAKLAVPLGLLYLGELVKPGESPYFVHERIARAREQASATERPGWATPGHPDFGNVPS